MIRIIILILLLVLTSCATTPMATDEKEHVSLRLHKASTLDAPAYEISLSFDDERFVIDVVNHCSWVHAKVEPVASASIFEFYRKDELVTIVQIAGSEIFANDVAGTRTCTVEDEVAKRLILIES